MAAIIFGKDELFGEWAAKRIPAIGEAKNFGGHVALGVATGFEKTDRLLAVVVFHDFQQKYGTCQISFAAADPRWASKQTIRALLAVPFLQYQCQKTWCAIPHTSERTVKLTKAIGFKQEAVLKDHFGRGTHAIITRMSDGRYKNLYWPQKQAKAA